MPAYRCLVSGSRGETACRIIAPSEAEAIRQWERRGSAGESERLISVEPIPEPQGRFRSFRGRRAVLEFSEMMTVLLNAGLSVKDALEILIAMGDAPAARLGNRILEQINRGLSLALAIDSLEKLFPPLYRGMIRLGDQIGSIEAIFPRLSAYLRDRKQLAEKAAAALIYPILVLILSAAGSLALVFGILPKLESVFGDLGGTAAETIHRNIWVIKTLVCCFLGILLPAIPAIPGILVLRRKHPAFAYHLDSWLLKLPIVGAFILSWESLNFSFAMEILSGGRVPVESALDEAAQVVSNTAYRRAIHTLRDTLIKGGSMAQSFAAETLFPPYMRHWIALGERAGKTEQIFSQIRRFFQEDLEQKTARFLLLLEPAMIVLTGLVVLGLVIGIILPLFSIYGNVL